MTRMLFGTDGVRGRAGEYPLDDATVRQIGLAVAWQFGQPDKYILLGRDPRQSSPHIAEVLAEGLVNGGAKVKVIGVITTPGLAYLTIKTAAAAGVMVTASHNPYTDNGIKVFTPQGQKLTDQQEITLNAAIKNASPSNNLGAKEAAPDLLNDYVDFLVNSAQGANLAGLKIAIDSANGSASGLAERVFKRLGAAVTALFDKPDGRNINDGCGATNLLALQKEVSNKGLDAGVALDGDADRVVLVDDKGREVNGDHIMYILAVTAKRKGVVATIMTNHGLEAGLNARGIKLRRTGVGDRYVMEGLRDSGFGLGGEQSGHIVIPQLLPTGDGLLAAVQTLIAVKASGKSLAQWCDELKLLPQAIVNITVDDKTLLDNPQVQQLIKAEAGSLAGRGRIVVRPSGTEPVVRVMVEAPDAKAVAEVAANKLQKLMESL